MPELHPTHCECQDCSSRRLISDCVPATERYSEDELEDFGHLLKQSDPNQEHD
jgi:hypothetical protein